MKPIKTSVRGQTIIEVLIASVILSLLLSGLIVSGLYAIKNTTYSKNKSLATKLATEQMERLRVVRDINNLTTLQACANPCYVNSSLNIVNSSFASGNFTGYVNVVTPAAFECPLPPLVTGTAVKAVVDVRWDVIPNVTPPRQVELNSCFTDWK